MTMPPIKRMVLYKHGVGYFERRGQFHGETLTLSFPRTAMDDVLKSLIVIDRSGQVRNIDFTTPEDRTDRLARSGFHLSQEQSLLDLLRDLRGRSVRLTLAGKQAEQVKGLVIGVDVEHEQPLRRALVSLYLSDQRVVRPFALDDIVQVELLEEVVHNDLIFFLHADHGDRSDRSVTVHLTPGDHDLLIGYVAPAPAWRVSYRLLFEEDGNEARCWLQGWGLFDNLLDEDLRDVAVTLVAGQPISFRYRLYQPQTPDRPVVTDRPPLSPKPKRRASLLEESVSEDDIQRHALAVFDSTEAAESTPTAASGEDRDVLFAYRVHQPVSVGRGQSAMAPIVGSYLPARRVLVYNSKQMNRYPFAALFLTNTTDLTLEQGPVTVLIGGEYAGEAVVPFTRAGAEIKVLYAAELGVTVSESFDTQDVLRSIRLGQGDLIADSYRLTFSRYKITSTLAKSCTVTIEHTLSDNAELVDTPPPQSQTNELASWNVEVPAFGSVEFTVCERSPGSRYETISSLTGEKLQAWLHDKVIDDTTFQRLSRVLNLLRQIDAAKQQIVEYEREQQRIFERQKRLQQQLTSLHSDGEEGVLRQRYVATLDQLENQLEQIEAAITDQQNLIKKLKDRLDRILRQLQ